MNIEVVELLYKSRCKELLEKKKDYKRLNDFNYFSDIEFMNESTFKEIIRRKQNRKNKRYRYHKAQMEMYKLQEGTNYKTVLGTLTIDEEHYKLQERTLRKKINEWLKRHFIYAIVYDDYGSKNRRLHYHFEGLTNHKMIIKEDIKSKKGNYIYEFIDKDYTIGFEPTLVKINFQKYDMKNSMNYILKLNNHATKNSTKSRFRVIKSPILKLIEKKIEK